MTMTKTRNTAKILLTTIMLALTMMFVSPISAFATDSGNTASGKTENNDNDSNYSGNINEVGVEMVGGKLTFAGDLNTTSNNQSSTWTNLMNKYKGVVIGVAGIGTVTMILMFVMNWMKLAGTSGNPQERQKVVHALIYTGIATAGLGSVTVFVALFYYILR